MNCEESLQLFDAVIGIIYTTFFSSIFYYFLVYQKDVGIREN